ncbi:hypothetical protein B0T11DRAFT_47784 [Plectosphaerella cucumerina]|uniref:Uncharacterized protein n=1 Tax=Plectosphaerella cucumerina TaxID=40658 RepID=A0A8K0X6F5_9PEZI|nr:hypothetical protein B0T11DRAFT_47784 [Plectosphaerella cucumerina]
MTPSLPPRFLLPALGPMWRAAPRAAGSMRVLRRHASTTGKEKPIVLEKPARFNPPSHGARLPRKTPNHYGGGLTEGEKFAQGKRDYPGLMPPVGSKAHKFINSRNLHMAITLGTLLVLAITTFILNFTHTSPFAHLLPPASEFWSSPVNFIRTWMRVLALHERDRNERAIADHTALTNDVVKRAYFRKVHGLDKENPIRNLLGGGDGDEMNAEALAAVSGEPVPSATATETPTLTSESAEATSPEPKKKWLGIF